MKNIENGKKCTCRIVFRKFRGKGLYYVKYCGSFKIFAAISVKGPYSGLWCFIVLFGLINFPEELCAYISKVGQEDYSENVGRKLLRNVGNYV
jgi:hypothetical protein